MHTEPSNIGLLQKAPQDASPFPPKTVSPTIQELAQQAGVHLVDHEARTALLRRLRWVCAGAACQPFGGRGDGKMAPKVDTSPVFGFEGCLVVVQRDAQRNITVFGSPRILTHTKLTEGSVLHLASRDSQHQE